MRFVFGYDASRPMVSRASAIEERDYGELVRKTDEAFKRAHQPRVKEQVVKERDLFNLQLLREDLAELEHQPSKAERSYRFVVLRKTVMAERGQQCLDVNFRYFFYITNDRTMTAEQVVREANDRCNQENLIEQLKNGVRALHAPLNMLEANWAYMVIASLAWTLKAWFALTLPVSPRWRAQHEAQRERVLRMDHHSFVQRLMLIPAQILVSGRQLIYRLLAWRPELPVLFRLLDAL